MTCTNPLHNLEDQPKCTKTRAMHLHSSAVASIAGWCFGDGDLCSRLLSMHLTCCWSLKIRLVLCWANGSEEKCLKCLKKWALLGILAVDKAEHNEFWKDALTDSSSGNGSGSSGCSSRRSSSILT